MKGHYCQYGHVHVSFVPIHTFRYRKKNYSLDSDEYGVTKKNVLIILTTIKIYQKLKPVIYIKFD